MIDKDAFYEAIGEPESLETEKLIKDCLDQGEVAGDILNQGLLEAMDIIGEQFRQDEIYIPEVLLAARNLHKGLDILRPLLAEAGVRGKGVFVIGTVQGDIHDVGKNIVSIMLEGAGFEVIDLGVDVLRETFVQAIDKYKPDILGLSALLTTTMTEMRHIISNIKEQKGDKAPKVIVGGAAVNQTFADSIGADGYGADALSGVEVALKLLGK